MIATVGQFLVNAALPPSHRDYKRVIDKKSMNALLEDIAKRESPEVYKETIHKMYQLGKSVAHSEGSSLRLSDLKPSPRVERNIRNLRKKVVDVINTPGITTDEIDTQLKELITKEAPRIDDELYQDLLDHGNSFAIQVSSGSRGGKGNLRGMLLGDLLVTDQDDKIIPIPVLRGYARGLTPAEFWATTYGARKGVVATKLCLAEDTSVRMFPSGHKRISDIQVGELVATLGENDKVIGTRVLSVFNNGYRACSLYSFASDADNWLVEVNATEDHKVLVTDGKVRKLMPLKKLVDSKSWKLVTPEDCPGSYALNYVGDPYSVATYDLEVEHPSHVFILSSSMVVSNSTQEAGFLGKQLIQAAHRMVVTSDDCGTKRGMLTQANDGDNVGAVLAETTGNYPAGTVITSAISKELGEREILVRSTTTCTADHGVCAKCSGLREHGKFANIGDNLGIPAAQSLGERLSQGSLCLAEGTLVRMADGSEQKIESIETGMRVLGADNRGATFPVEVVRRYDNGVKVCNNYTVIAKRCVSIVCTPDHKLLTRTPFGRCRKKAIGKITFMDRVVLDGDFGLLDQVYTPSVSLPTYDLEVAHPDHLFVLANGLIVSNSTKHSAGRIDSNKKPGPQGFSLVNQLVQVPTSFQGGATVATVDGKIGVIEDAPQGGKYVVINGEKHFVAPGLEIKVRPGQDIEAGDLLSDGIPNPADLVRYRGVGDGRVEFVNLFRKAFHDSGIPAHRRNIELLARGLVNHVEVSDLDAIPGALPGDVVEYDGLEREYEPRFGVQKLPVAKALNKYLEKPVLQYSIGTRLNKRVAGKLAAHGITDVDVHDDPPAFEPRMIRAMETMKHTPDWQTRLGGWYLQSGLMNALVKGVPSEVHSTSYISGLARGVGFGKDLKTQGIY
jgi:hypothetical protein